MDCMPEDTVTGGRGRRLRYVEASGTALPGPAVRRCRRTERGKGMDRAQAELARGVERYMFRRVAADPSPLLDDHTREIIAEAIAWAVTRAIGMQADHVSGA